MTALDAYEVDGALLPRTFAAGVVINLAYLVGRRQTIDQNVPTLVQQKVPSASS